MKRNILLINHYAGSPTHGMEYRPYYLAREWVRLGHRVTIAAASCSHVRQQAPVFQGPIGEELLDGIRYLWLRTPKYHGNGWKRAVNMFYFVAQLYRWQNRLIGDAKLDTVIASSTYPLDIYPARRIASRQQASLIFEVHDLWPLSPIELGGMSPQHPFIWAIQRAEDYAYRYADRVVSFLPKADQYMVGRGMGREKYAHLPNGVAVNEWHNSRMSLPREHRITIDRLRSEGRFLVGYAGAFGIANALDSLVRAAVLLQDSPATFVLVGQGPEKHRLQQQVASLGLKNVTILPAIPRASVPALLAKIDAAYIGLQHCSLFRFGVSPNKLMDYMMAGNPIIHAIDAGNDLVGETQCGISIAPENPRQIAKAVNTLMTKSQTALRQMGARGKAYIQKNHNYSILAKRFIDLMDEASNSHRAVPHEVSLNRQENNRHAA